MTHRPLPRVEVELGRTVPGSALHAAAVLVTGGTPLLAALGSSATGEFLAFWILGAVAIGGWAAWRPGHPPALTGAATTALLLAVASADGGVSAALWLAPLAYLGIRLSTWAAATGLTTRVEVAALARSARADGVVVVVTLLVGAVASVLDGGSVTGLVIGAVALLGLVLLVLRTQDGRP
ncbi:putative membrane protein, glycine-rich [Xylanimonas cellulosilytica DSM 15894]|uniref:Membrane protein, glycine-rich n=1 Tax=Xylanimonas cellulosilytica (strain DSM 15894 / JCM 12276 / CECT 5975 / KCTC 9989 / LMG 20990 / NBRC 107835 / XIL07) TaxID=446471 RepID=D1BSW7_XYLCX|nr:hypothetical protein [Xylanimonas cellulosilytica]ACZ30809.1 putative membrane protein, glycine-rich [Xylanimonas cellulosilytica DSM 15894]